MSPSIRSQAVQIEALELVRAPGMPRSFRLTGFGPGINVVWGPNGSGKSSTARAMHSLFWPDRNEDGVQVEASVRDGQAAWQIRRDGKRVSATRNGAEHAPLTFPHLTLQSRDRYLLALHELLEKTDKSFAREISNEMSGGYDIAAASAVTGYEKSGNARSEARALSTAHKAHKALLAAHSQIANEEETLALLEAEVAAVTAATLRRGQLEKVRDALGLKDHHEEALNLFKRFDPILEQARASDADTLAAWERDEPLLLSQRTRDQQQRASLAEKRDALGLADADSVRLELARLQQQLEALRASEQHLAKVRVELAAAREHAIQLSANIGPALPADLPIDRAVKLLNDFAAALDRHAEAERIAGAERILAERIGPADEQIDLYAPEDRLRALASWLQTPPPADIPAIPRSIRLLTLVAGLVIIGQAALLGYYWHEYAYGIAIVGVAVLGLALLLRGPSPHEDRHTQMATAYLERGYPEPATWDANGVAAEISATIAELQHAHSANLHHQIWQQLRPSLEERATRLHEAADGLASVEAEIGTDVKLDRTALSVLAQELGDSLQATRKVRELEALATKCEEEWGADLRLFNETVTSGTPHAAIDTASASVLLTGLNHRFAELIRLDRQISEIDTRLNENLLPALNRIATERAELIQRYGDRPLDEIIALASQFPTWSDARSVVRTRADQLDHARSQLDAEFSLDEWPIERVETEIASCRSIEERAADTNQQIGRIKTRIEQAKRSDDVAKALEQVDDARNALIQKRDELIRTAVGRLVLDQVRAETRDSNLPEVARRARELFVAFTHGRYELRMSQAGEPAFTAWDTHLSREQALDELSSATRVQLLIAVRMAFVERQEGEFRLPMIFDETLANADDHRADALIETTFEIASAGRQVFYFTAQLDEVQKWQAHAQANDIEIAIIDLAEARQLAERGRQPLVALAPFERPVIPHFGDESREEYRLTLAVPHLDLWNDEIDGAHLWYLIDDIEELHRLIASHGVTTWGQVRNYGATSAPALGIDTAAFTRLTACADALKALIGLTRIGRGKPVTSAALRESGGLTDTYEDACEEVLKLVNGDGKLFIRQLEEKSLRSLRGFRSAQIEKFREYFEENGHIVEDATLTADVIRGRLARHCEGAIARGEIDLHVIDRLLTEAFPAPESMIHLARTTGIQTTLLPSGE